MVNCEVSTEGSETARVGTDEQERHRRHVEKDECPQLHDVRNWQSNAKAPKGDFQYVDVAGIDSKESALTRGGLRSYELTERRSQQRS